MNEAIMPDTNENTVTDAAQGSAAQSSRKPFARPEVVELGSLQTLTLEFGGTF